MVTVVTQEPWGEAPGQGTVDLWRVESPHVKVEVVTLGATLRSVLCKGRDQEWADVVLGYSDIQGYLSDKRYLGAVVGRVANRIAKGCFVLDDKEYQLDINNGPNALHGGLRGFNKALWKALPVEGGVQLSLTSPDGDQGYPGEVQVTVTYLLQGETLTAEYQARSTKTTPINLTNHSYFNLAGQTETPGGPLWYCAQMVYLLSHRQNIHELYLPYEPSWPLCSSGSRLLVIPKVRTRTHGEASFQYYGPHLWNGLPENLRAAENAQAVDNVYDHEVSINAECYLPVDNTSIPTGEIRAVEGTPFDLRRPVLLGPRLMTLPGPGFDHNFCLCSYDEPWAERPAARVCHPPSGRVLEVSTSQPGLQFYTANYLDDSITGKDGVKYRKHCSFCLETQNWPDSVNQTSFPNCLLRPGELYRHVTRYTFTTC